MNLKLWKQTVYLILHLQSYDNISIKSPTNNRQQKCDIKNQEIALHVRIFGYHSGLVSAIAVMMIHESP
jgi:hypothetical protein